MEEIFRIADRITVMRDGETVGTRPASELTRESLIEMMVGRKLENEFPKERAEIGEKHLEAIGLRRGEEVKDVSFFVRRGEILAFDRASSAQAGRRLPGSSSAPTRATWAKSSSTAAGRDSFAARRHPRRICLLTEDRKTQGLVLGLSVRENFGLPNLTRLSGFGFIQRMAERDALCPVHQGPPN